MNRQTVGGSIGKDSKWFAQEFKMDIFSGDKSYYSSNSAMQLLESNGYIVFHKEVFGGDADMFYFLAIAADGSHGANWCNWRGSCGGSNKGEAPHMIKKEDLGRYIDDAERYAERLVKWISDLNKAKEIAKA